MSRRTGNDPRTGKSGPVDAVRNPDGSISLVRRSPVGAPKALTLAERLHAHGLLAVVQRHAAAHGVTIADVLGRSRHTPIAAARHAAWREIRETTRLSLPRIGDLFGRHHTSILHAVRGIAKAKPPTVETIFAAMLVI